jgi:small-conductance mechanosensitive channel
VKFLIFWGYLLLQTPLSSAESSAAIPADVEVMVSSETSDTKVEQRLMRVFTEISDLSQVQVAVSNGVVTLTGSVPSSMARKEAKALTQNTEGVIYVQDRLDDQVEVGARLAPARDKALELVQSSIRKLPLFAIALLCVVIAWLLGSWLSKRLVLFRRLGLNELSASLLGRVLKLAFIGFGIFSALEVLDATAIAAGVLGVAGVAGVALGFAFRNIVENYLAGILLSLRNPFSTGDAVEIGEHSGKVVRLTSRDTVLMTYDGNHLRIPNSQIITSALTNLSRNPLRRFDFAIGVSTDLDMTVVRKLGIDTLSQISSVLADPAPHILIEALGDSTVNMRFYGWVDQRKSDFAKTKSEAIRLVKDAFDGAEIEMPEPIYRVHLHQAGDLKPPSKKASPEHCSTAADLSVDDTIDRQVAAVHSADGESNLLVTLSQPQPS